MRLQIEVDTDTRDQLWRRRLIISLRDRRSIHHVRHDEIINAAVTALLTRMDEVADDAGPG